MPKATAQSNPGFHSHPFQGPDGAGLMVWRRQADAPRGTLLVAHGMAEHGGRYAHLAQHLAPLGWSVIAPDQRGHGQTGARQLGDPGAGGWSHFIADLAALAGSADGPVVLLGHSMGSFIAQDFIARHGDRLAGAILSAPEGATGPLRLIGQALVRLETLIKGRTAPATLAERLSFAEFNKAFAPNRSGFDWLSRDEAEVDRYIADPLCGFTPAGGLWLELLAAIGRLEKASTRAQVPASLPLLLIAGDADPACRGEQGPQALAAGYRRAGVEHVDMKLYPGARHELLNETCREQVMADIAAWLDTVVPAPAGADES